MKSVATIRRRSRANDRSEDEKLKEETRLQGDINSRRDEIKKIKDELAVNQKTIEGLSQNRSQRSTIKAQLCSRLEKTFSQSIERLRDRLRQAVQDRANEAFHELITQKSYRGLEINKNYGLSIVDDMHRHVPIRSAGAEQIVALSAPHLMVSIVPAGPPVQWSWIPLSAVLIPTTGTIF